MTQPPYTVIQIVGEKRSGRVSVLRGPAALLWVFGLSCATAAVGQMPSSMAPSQGGSQSDSSAVANPEGVQPNGSRNENGNGDLLADAANQSSAGRLSSDQITSILEQNPDLLIELKAQLAERMTQQGIAIEVDDISDQMVYNQLATDSQLRANIGAVLQARGYGADGELSASGAPAGAGHTTDAMPASDGSLLRLDGTAPDAISFSNQGGTGPGQSSGTTPGEMRLAPNRQSTRHNAPGSEKANASTDPPAVLHQATPLALQSMRDLYTQVPNETKRLTRFGSDVFINRTASTVAPRSSALNNPPDVPMGPDYIIGAGDQLTIALWGGATQSFVRTVDREGRILLPEAGALQIAGLPLERAQALITDALKQQYRNAQVAVTVSGLRSVRVYVVGDVQSPGGYDISSLATPVSALYAAGGPTAVGSLRKLQHYRGKELVEDVDLYDFLLHGLRGPLARFQSGDTLLVPPAGPQVAISGAVKREAIYELKPGETMLSAVIDDAGGLTAAASLNHIRIERIDANRQRVTVTLPKGGPAGPNTAQEAMEHFEVEDGDRIRVEPILSYSQRAVYLAGHVVRPGRVAFTDGMRLSDVIRSYQDLLPEPAERGEIVRLVPPDLHAEAIDFDVPDVMIGNANLDLEPFDTIRVFGRYQADAPRVTIRGEVMEPGTYPLSNGMTAAQLVRIAGGFKRDALLESADLTSYEVKDGNQVSESIATVRIGDAVTRTSPGADVPLRAGDILAVHQISNWENIGESVTILGQVKYPGSYGFRDGERLSDVLRRAGGLLPAAYAIGAVLIREQVKTLEQSSRDELIRQIETNAAAARLSPSISASNSPGALQLIKAQQEEIIADLKSHPPTGRMVIHITRDIDSWANTSADVELRKNDELTIPKEPGFVLVTGQVYNATALTFTWGKTAAWYLGHAGGTNSTANRKEIFIIRANGSVVGRNSGGAFRDGVLSTTLNAGDVVVVPQKLVGGSLFWRNLLATGQIAASVAVSAGVAAATL